MTRRTAAATATAALALLGCVATTTPALASTTPSAPPALGRNLHYRTTTWTAGGTAMSVMAPRGWTFVLTPEGQARFNAPARPDVLTMGYRSGGFLRRQLHGKVAALRGTPGLHVVEASVHGRGDAVTGELRYRWTPRGGETRFVHYRYQGDDIYEVAGRAIDRPGLERVLANAADTGECS